MNHLNIGLRTQEIVTRMSSEQYLLSYYLNSSQPENWQPIPYNIDMLETKQAAPPLAIRIHHQRRYKQANRDANRYLNHPHR